jgi:acyl-CoA reductase-like NAD-dependent aldehyde dehydrogenase
MRFRISIYNPANGELVSDKIPVAGEDDVDEAVEFANKAFALDSPWRRMTNPERQKLLLKFADLLETNQERLAKLTRVTLGAPYTPFGQGEIATAIGCFRCTRRIHSPRSCSLTSCRLRWLGR